MARDTLPALPEYFLGGEIYFGNSHVPPNTNSLQGVTGEGLVFKRKKGASPPFIGNALKAKSYLCLDRRSIIGIFEIWL
jgi:hypothetical protein